MATVKNASVHGGVYGTTIDNMVPHQIPISVLVTFDDGSQKSFNIDEDDGREAFGQLWRSCGLPHNDVRSTKQLIGRHTA